ncbi:hypothetical protein D3C84_1132510 [compost metagenome]
MAIHIVQTLTLVRLVYTHVDDMHRAAMPVRLVVLEQHIIFVMHFSDFGVGRTLRIGSSQIGPGKARAVEVM